ncbi:MAG TPA: hypothetical protein VFR81_21790 [Longimicrobium sp.]|nr:hypothetical protein [Longimicrobium sp.]
MPRPLKLVLLLVLLGMMGFVLVRLFAPGTSAPADASAEGAAGADSAAADPPPPFVAGATDDCASPATDSARAVCVAVRAARGEGGIGARVAEVVRQGDLVCVRTVPVDPTANRGTMVRVDREGRVRGLVLTDSAGSCGDLPPAGGDSNEQQGDR